MVMLMKRMAGERTDMHLDASNIFNILLWLDEDSTPNITVRLYEPLSIVREGDVGIPPSGSINIRTVHIMRETAHLNNGYTVEYARQAGHDEPLVFGRPMTIEAYHDKKLRQG